MYFYIYTFFFIKRIICINSLWTALWNSLKISSQWLKVLFTTKKFGTSEQWICISNAEFNHILVPNSHWRLSQRLKPEYCNFKISQNFIIFYLLAINFFPSVIYRAQYISLTWCTFVFWFIYENFVSIPFCVFVFLTILFIENEWILQFLDWSNTRGMTKSVLIFTNICVRYF